MENSRISLPRYTHSMSDLTAQMPTPLIRTTPKSSSLIPLPNMPLKLSLALQRGAL